MVKNLKKLRIQASISQQALATAVGVSQQSINKYENHAVEPDIATLIALADYLGVTIDYLVGRTDEAGNNHLLSDEELLVKYRQLRDSEKACVRMVVDTLHQKK
ncbi:MAG: helix-turn-helix transcriptional regulator [Clostridia bacterium]|nr:helix-turn-helix transcriptional regulator [Clostridia bacterium]